VLAPPAGPRSSFFRHQPVVWIAALVALAAFLALYWIAASTGPSTFDYELR
jgi:hypothetical protein